MVMAVFHGSRNVQNGLDYCSNMQALRADLPSLRVTASTSRMIGPGHFPGVVECLQPAQSETAGLGEAESRVFVAFSREPNL